MFASLGGGNNFNNLIMYFLLGTGLYVIYKQTAGAPKQISYQDFVNLYLQRGNVEKIIIQQLDNSAIAHVVTKDNQKVDIQLMNADNFLAKLDQIQ